MLVPVAQFVWKWWCVHKASRRRLMDALIRLRSKKQPSSGVRILRSSSWCSLISSMRGGGKQKEAKFTGSNVLPVPFDNLEATLLPAVQPMEHHFIVGKRKWLGHVCNVQSPEQSMKAFGNPPQSCSSRLTSYCSVPGSPYCQPLSHPIQYQARVSI